MLTRINQKIRVYIYLILTLLVNFFLYRLTDQSIMSILCLALIAIATTANHAVLIYAVSNMIEQAKNKDPSKQYSKNIGILFIIKFLLLGVSLLIGIHFMQGLVIIPLISYVLQLGILMISLKRKSAQ